MLSGPIIHASEDPLTRYTISVVSVIVSFGGVLALIFVPKIIAVEYQANDGTDSIIELGKGKLSSFSVAFVTCI